MAFYNNGIGNQNGGNQNANGQPIEMRGQNNRHARGHRREPTKKPATQQRSREPRANNQHPKEPYHSKRRVFNQTSSALEGPRRGRRGQMRLAPGDKDIEMADAPSLEIPEPKDIIMRDAPIPRRVRRKKERRLWQMEALIQQFQRCKLEYRAQRDKDNDVIMGEAPPLVY
ncbi:hypothetical protein HFD88_007874 [Aspergillus terreus]|nr:hypothetical protein HFD88_007874 [Aspergillus terreus]